MTNKKKFDLDIPMPNVGELLIGYCGNPFFSEADIPAVVQRLREEEKQSKKGEKKIGEQKCSCKG